MIRFLSPPSQFTVALFRVVNRTHLSQLQLLWYHEARVVNVSSSVVYEVTLLLYLVTFWGVNKEFWKLSWSMCSVQNIFHCWWESGVILLIEQRCCSGLITALTAGGQSSCGLSRYLAHLIQTENENGWSLLRAKGFCLHWRLHNKMSAILRAQLRHSPRPPYVRLSVTDCKQPVSVNLRWTLIITEGSGNEPWNKKLVEALYWTYYTGLLRVL